MPASAVARSRRSRPLSVACGSKSERSRSKTVVERARDGFRLDGAGVELADVEHGREQRGHRVERELLALEHVAQRGVAAGVPHCGAIQQIQGLQRLAQVVARSREQAALRAVGLDQLALGVAAHGRVADAATTSWPLVARTGLKLISTGNSLPRLVQSEQREIGPIGRDFGAARSARGARVRGAQSRRQQRLDD